MIDTRYFVFDTETTGLIKKIGGRYPAPNNVNAYDDSRILEIAWVIYHNEIVDFQRYLVNNLISIPEAATKIHGITEAMITADGMDLMDILEILSNSIKNCDFIVGHNVDFDILILESELYRLNTPCSLELIEMIKSKKIFDTMKIAQTMFNLPTYPKLGWLYHQLTGLTFDAHHALDDVIATLVCLLHIN